MVVETASVNANQFVYGFVLPIPDTMGLRLFCQLLDTMDLRPKTKNTIRA